MVLACLAAFGCAWCYGAGSVLQSVGARRLATADGLNPALLVRLARQLPYLIGLALDLVGWLLSLLALRWLPLFAVQAILAGSVGVTALLATVFLNSRPSGRQFAVLGGLAVGLILLAATAEPGSSRDVAPAVSWGIALGVPVVAVAAGGVVRSARDDRAGALLGVLSGVAFGGAAVCARVVEGDLSWQRVLTGPAGWALLGYGALGLTTFAAALQRGSVTIVMAGQCAAETVLPAAVGVVLLGDAARPGAALPAVAGFVIAVAAAIALVAGGTAEAAAPVVGEADVPSANPAGMPATGAPAGGPSPRSIEIS
jgi:drug/metabolite transporter (DMT)-like permease